ncbi:MAG: HAMP domain-containing sensor histidine kinase [Polyangiaceae bacterium]
MAESRAPGLRVQVVLSLGALMVLAFVPLFFAVASLARASLSVVTEQSAKNVGRAVASHVESLPRPLTRADYLRALSAHLDRSIRAGCALDRVGYPLACVGPEPEVATLRKQALLPSRDTSAIRSPSGNDVDVVMSTSEAQLSLRVRVLDEATRASPLVRLVALYMVVFGLALLTFASFTINRVIVRPLDALVRAADRVAFGARKLDVPRGGASELVDLGASLRAMTAKLVSDEEAMRSKVEELTQTTTRLTETRAQLEGSERLASVGRLAAGVAHEIGNPIASLMGLEDLLLEGDLSPETQKDFLVRMRKETDRIHGVVRDLLDFARPEHSTTSTTMIAAGCKVSDVVDDVFALVRPQKNFKAIVLEREIPSPSPFVAIPAPRLTQVLLNTLMNAGDAIHGARGSEARPATGRIVLRVAVADDVVRIDVEDDGPGIPEEVRARVFEPFVTTKDVGAGTGLGLAVCRGLIEGAKGRIEIDPTYTSGARIVIRLPKALSFD